MNKASNIVTAVGAMAEISAVFYKTLRNAKLPKSACLDLTKMFLYSTINDTTTRSKRKETDDGD